MSARRVVEILLASVLLQSVFCAAQNVATPLNSPATLQGDEDPALQQGHWSRSIKTLLVTEKFDDLDRIADQYRREKTRVSGGGWKLKELYEVLDAPQQTDKDYVEHLDHLRKWMQLRPESITARVALATSLTRWAWVARGNGLANTVTGEGWRLFNQRATEALIVLRGSADMHTMCPQWFSEMMVVGLALGWDSARMEDTYNRAVQFEPDYQYFYKARANYLLPKWYGQGNDATDFARNAADKLGGDLGDIMYFKMATVILKRGNGNITSFLKAMDWQRIQRGYQLTNEQFGREHRSDNAIAFMAYRYKDTAVAQQQFALIGNDWSQSVWRDKNSYDRARDWSTGHTSWP